MILFTVDEHTFIDAGVDGNDAQYFNHSCAPNCEAVLEAGQIYIEALRLIKSGEELTYDYRLEHPEPFDPGAAQRYACHCGVPDCRGTLLEPRAPSQPKPNSAVAPQLAAWRVNQLSHLTSIVEIRSEARCKSAAPGWV